MSLIIDIKADDQFEKQALKTAKALDEITHHEKKVNDLATKLGVTNQKASQAMGKVAKQEQEQDKKKSAATKKFSKDVGAVAHGFGLVGASITAAGVAAVGLGAELANLAFKADQSKRGATSMIDAFTHGHGAESIKILDNLATKLGLSWAETRNKFVEYRQAGLNNKMAVAVIKQRADIMALGNSAEVADAQIAHVLQQGHNAAGAAQMFRLVARAFHGAGTGAIAAEYATRDFGAALNKVNNVANDRLANFWEKVGPSIGKAANRLADFLDKLMTSKEGENAISGIARSVNELANSMSSDKFAVALKEIKYFASGVETAMAPVLLVFKALGKAIDGVSFVIAGLSKVFSFKDFSDQLGLAANDAALAAKKAELNGQAIGEGLSNGIRSKSGDAAKAAVETWNMTDDRFTKAAGINSPSKVFAGYGEDTVEGFRIGQERSLTSTMPIQAAALKQPTVTAAPQSSGSSAGITIQNLVVHGGKPEDIARSIRQELQLLLQAGSLSRGMQ